MGMSASQVRLLTITKRIHSVENEAERIQNQKMLLGLQSDEAYEEYLAAMEKKDVEYAWFNGNTGTFDWSDLDLKTLYNLKNLIGTDYRLKVKNLKGYEPLTVKVLGTETQGITADVKIENLRCEGTSAPYTLKGEFDGQDITIDGSYQHSTPQDFTISGFNFLVSGNEAKGTIPGTKYTVELPDGTSQSVIANNALTPIPAGKASIILDPSDPDHSTYKGIISSNEVMLQRETTDEFVICNNLKEACTILGIAAGADAIEDKDVFREIIYNAYAIIESKIYDEDKQQKIWKETSVATNVGLREKTDDKELAKAEAEYEAALRRIDKKEEQYDKDLAKFDQERKALTTQLDTLKTCIKENIDRTFKIFQG